jgi:general secretion pathway protein G
MNSDPTHRNTGFTLVELIVTVTIIILLAGLVVGGFGYVREKQALETAKIQIALLSRGIDEYRLDMGLFPGEGNANEYGGNATPADGDNSQVLYQALYYEGWNFVESGRPSNWATHRASTIYVAELDPITTSQGWVIPSSSATPPQNLKITDPWGNNFRYRVGSDAMNPDFDLWSAGKDAATIPGSSGSPYNPNAAENRDDIRNF